MSEKKEEEKIMKIYNIENTKPLFEKLTACKGDIELVGENGQHITLSHDHNKEQLALMAETFVNGSIKELELSFSDGTDAVGLFQFLTSMNNAA